MTHYQRVQVGTEAEKDEAILDSRVLPLRCNAAHIYSICTLYVIVKPFSRLSNG
jgi:hypothetical protein